jgi:hypothetical protein
MSDNHITGSVEATRSERITDENFARFFGEIEISVSKLIATKAKFAWHQWRDFFEASWDQHVTCSGWT